MKIIVVSDIHINSYSSKKDRMMNFLRSLETDLLVINGDLYDLYVGPPKEDIISEIKKNAGIKSIVYIKGNHDYYIKDHFPHYNVQEVFYIADIVITHGNQYDTLSDEIPTDSWLSHAVMRVRYFIEKTFKFNIRILLKKISFGLLDKTLLKSHEKAVLENPGKKVILGHTHLPLNEHPMYNCGCMCDDHFTYMEISINDKGESIINLIRDN